MSSLKFDLMADSQPSDWFFMDNNIPFRGTIKPGHWLKELEEVAKDLKDHGLTLPPGDNALAQEIDTQGVAISKLQERIRNVPNVLRSEGINAITRLFWETTYEIPQSLQDMMPELDAAQQAIIYRRSLLAKVPGRAQNFAIPPVKPNTPLYRDGRTLIHIGIINGDLEIVKRRMEANENLDNYLEIVRNHLPNPLKPEHRSVFQYLQFNGIDVPQDYLPIQKRDLALYVQAKKQQKSDAVWNTAITDIKKALTKLKIVTEVSK